ncbi:MAG: efflux RND transporter permease subunit [Bacilli bacterium]|nr:efflux RND transporter permease subunit [Bacilli bacterium]
MLVDNAIVVIENIFRLRSDGVSIKDAAKQGAGQVVNAIIAATLTTIAVFLPIIFLEGMIAEIFKQLALTVSFALLSSLIVAMTLVPMMASKMFKTKNKQNIRLMLKTKQLYEKYLNFALKYKFLMIILVLIIFGGSIWGLTKIGTEYIPSGMEDHLMIDLEMPEEITFTEKKELYDQFMNMAMSIEGVETVAISLLKDDINIMGGNNYVFVIKDEESKRTYDEIKADILTETKDDPFIVHIQSEIEMTNMVSSGIKINIIGDDLNTLNEITNNFMNIINNIEGINNVTSNIDDNPSELRIIIDRKASISHGLTNYNVFSTLHDLLNPNYKATDININNRPFKVNVYPSKLNTITEEGLKNIIIDHTPLEDIADIIPSESWNSINRQNQNRYVSIQAEVKEDYNIGLIGEKVQTEIDKYEVPNGYEIILTGENEEINNALNSLIQAALLAVVLIYMVMAIQFESLLYPFIIMFTVPLAWTGSFLALLITGLPLSVVAFIGMIILAGIVVNNGIILVDYINQLKNEGKATKEAVIIAGKTRMRPILMTSLTTILALTVMALDIQKGTAMIRPMAITTIGGLIFATILTLFIIPCIYVIMDNIKLKIKGGN